jgi:hypothetical protein
MPSEVFMDFTKYENKLKFVVAPDFTTHHFYKDGACIKTLTPLTPSEEVNTTVPAMIKMGTVHEKIVDNEGYIAAKKEYAKENQRLHDVFVDDLLEEHGIPKNPFSLALVNMAYDEGHSSGYREVANCFIELADLYALAEKQFSPKS